MNRRRGVFGACILLWIIIGSYNVTIQYFRNSEVGIIGIFCVTSNGNKLEIVVNQMNLNTNLDLSRANVTGN